MFKRTISLFVSICVFCSVMPTAYAGTNPIDVFKDTKNVLAPTNVNSITLPRVVTEEALLTRATTDSKSGILRENLLLAMQYKINPAILKGVFTSRSIIDYDLTLSSPKITVSQFNAVDQVSYTFYKEQISNSMISKGFNSQFRITTIFKSKGEKVYTYDSSVLLKEENLKITNADEFYKYQLYSKESLEPQVYYVIDQTLDALYLPNNRNMTMASGLPAYDLNKMFNATKSLPNGMLSANTEYKNATPLTNKLFLYSYLKKMPTYYRFTRDFIEFSDGSKYVVLIDDTKKANGNPANTYAYFNIENGVEITDPNALTLLAKYYAMINSRPNFEKYYVKDFNLNYFTLLASMKASANATILATGITKALNAAKTGKKLAAVGVMTKTEGKGTKDFKEQFIKYLNLAVIVYTIAEYSQPKSAAVYADQQLFNTKYAKDGCSLTRIDLSNIVTVNKKLNETIEKFVEAHYRYDMTYRVLDKMDQLPKGDKATEILYYGLKHTTEGFLDSINIFGKKKSSVISNVANDLIKESSKAALDLKFTIGMSKQDFSEAVIEIGGSTLKIDTGYVLAKVIDEVVKSGESKVREDFAKKIVDKILSNEYIDPKFK